MAFLAPLAAAFLPAASSMAGPGGIVGNIMQLFMGGGQNASAASDAGNSLMEERMASIEAKEKELEEEESEKNSLDV